MSISTGTSAFEDSIARLQTAVGERRSADLPDPELASRLASLHADGITAFEEQGLPTRRSERWKGTSTGDIAALSIDRIGSDRTGSDRGVDADVGAIVGDPRVEAFAPDLLFVDGRMVRASASRADLPAGVRILSLAEAAGEVPETVVANLGRLADPKADAFCALHAALFEDAAIVELERGVRPGRALRVLSVTTSGAGGASACFPRLLFVAGESSEGMVLVESLDLDPGTSRPRGFTALVSEFLLSAAAKIEYVELQTESQGRVHLSQSFADLARDARFTSHVLSLSRGLVRSEVYVGLKEPGATTRMNGFFLGRDDAHHDHFTTVDHSAPHCASDEEYRGVLADESSGVFRGRVIVRPGAQKTDARQSNPNLILSPGAKVDTKPQLEIYADDVKASHGSTIGQLDEEALFFLRARGIAEGEARLLLTRGFARTIVDGIADDATRSIVEERVESALETLEGVA